MFVNHSGVSHTLHLLPEFLLAQVLSSVEFSIDYWYIRDIYCTRKVKILLFYC